MQRGQSENSSVAYFLDIGPKGVGRVLQALAAAESLTDEVARQIYELDPLEGIPSDLFVQALHYSGFTAPRSREWHFTETVREHFLHLGAATQDQMKAVHAFLLRIGKKATPGLEKNAIPRYLFTLSGKAYHTAALGQTKEALELYASASLPSLSGEQWLGMKLAEEQERTKVLPAGQVETQFLRAMVLYREGRRADAMPLLRNIAATDQLRIEVAIALHLLGNWDGQAPHGRKKAEELYRRSLEIGQALGDQHHLAQTLHSLANLIARTPSRRDEAEELYRRSLEIDETHSTAQTLHSLANLIGRIPFRREEAEELYRRSIEIDETLNNKHGVAQTLHSLANLIARTPSRRGEAEELYRRSLKIDETLNNQHGMAQTLHSLANLIGRTPRRRKEAEELIGRSLTIGEDLKNLPHQAQTLHSLANLIDRTPSRRREAEELYRRSLKIDEKLNNQHGMAQTLHSLANLIGRTPSRRAEAEEMMLLSLRIGEDLKNLSHQAQVLRSLSFIVEHRSPKEAASILERSLLINEKAGNTKGQRIVRESLRKLRDRYQL